MVVGRESIFSVRASGDHLRGSRRRYGRGPLTTVFYALRSNGPLPILGSTKRFRLATPTRFPADPRDALPGGVHRGLRTGFDRRTSAPRGKRSAGRVHPVFRDFSLLVDRLDRGSFKNRESAADRFGPPASGRRRLAPRRPLERTQKDFQSYRKRGRRRPNRSFRE